MNDKTLILNISETLANNLLLHKYVDILPVFKKVSFLGKIIRKIFFKINYPYPWFNQWDLNKYELIIVFDGEFSKHTLKYLHTKINNNQRVIMWYWNPVFLNLRYYKPKDLIKYSNEVWSFNPFDCKRYNLKYNSTFYTPDINLPDYTNEFDVYFLGKNKGRDIILKQLKKEFDKRQISSQIIIIDDNSNDQKPLVPKITYQENLDNISKTKAIIEVLQEDQNGCSLRPLEAIFFKRKVITNNIEIKNELFYNENNVFIIGIDSFDRLKKFIDSPFFDYPENVTDHYTFSSWINRFEI